MYYVLGSTLGYWSYKGPWDMTLALEALCFTVETVVRVTTEVYLEGDGESGEGAIISLTPSRMKDHKLFSAGNNAKNTWWDANYASDPTRAEGCFGRQ